MTAPPASPASPEPAASEPSAAPRGARGGPSLRSGRARSALLYGAVVAVLFTASALGSYVYIHHPARETIAVTLEAAATPGGARTVAGTVASVEGGRVVLSTESGPLTVTLPASAVLEELRHAPDGLAAGSRVNVGVQPTRYGLVLTGVVAIEGAR